MEAMATNPQAERDEKLRAELASLRLDRGAAAAPVKPRPPRRRLLPAMLAVVPLAALAAGIFLAGRAPPVTAADATPAAPGQAGPAPGPAGSGYVVTGDRYVSIRVR